MTLIEWMLANRIKVPWLQHKLDLGSPNSVYRYMRGEHMPAPLILFRIIDLTGGLVDANSCLEAHRQWLAGQQLLESHTDWLRAHGIRQAA